MNCSIHSMKKDIFWNAVVQNWFKESSLKESNAVFHHCLQEMETTLFSHHCLQDSTKCVFHHCSLFFRLKHPFSAGELRHSSNPCKRWGSDQLYVLLRRKAHPTGCPRVLKLLQYSTSISLSVSCINIRWIENWFWAMGCEVFTRSDQI